MKKRTIAIAIALFFLVGGNIKSQVNRNYTLVMRSNVGAGLTATLWDNNIVNIYGFASSLATQPTLPGPTIYAEEGDSILINALNLSQLHDHTIHMHGMDANQKNDGDPLTDHPIAHGQSRIYRVLADHAGTYVYHCHVEDVVHVQMGMYGLVVVKAAGGVKTAWTGGPPFDKSYNWLMTELDKGWHDHVPVIIDDTLRVPPFLPHYFLVNGKSQQQIWSDDSTKISGSKGQPIYMRLANIGYFGNKIVFPSSLHATLIDSDGRPLPNAIKNDTVEIMPGERYGVMLNATADLTDSVSISYVNLNTDSIWNIQRVPVNIGGSFSVHEITNNNAIRVYPNPASSRVSITYQGREKSNHAELVLMNAMGQVLIKESRENEHSSFSLDVSDLNEGLYIIKVTSENEFFYKKFLVKR